MFFYLDSDMRTIIDYSITKPYYITLTDKFYPIISDKQDEACGIRGTHTDNIYFFQENKYYLKWYDGDYDTSEIELNFTKIQWNELDKKYELYNNMDAIKQHYQNKNKYYFKIWLENNPLEWTEGEFYGITLEDQFELNLALLKYKQLKALNLESSVKLEWHAQKEENVEWVYEDLVNLSNAISEKVYDKYHLMQKYKTKIYNATTVKELKNMFFTYD